MSQATLDIELLPEAVFVFEALVLRDLNRRAAALIGAERACVIGRRADELLAEGEVDRLLEVDRQISVHWTLPETFRLRVRHPTRGSVLTDVRFLRVADLLVVTARDVTETSRGEDLIATLADLAAEATQDVESFLRRAEPHLAELGWTVAYSAVEPTGIVPRFVVGPLDDPVAQYGRSILGQILDPQASPIATSVAQSGRAVFLDNLPSNRPAGVLPRCRG